MPPLTKNLLALARQLIEKMPELRPYLTQAARAKEDIRGPLFRLQDKLVEHRMTHFPTRYMEEAAGDIFREMTMRQNPNYGYMKEKIGKLRWPERWSSGDWAIAEKGANEVNPEEMSKYKTALSILGYATEKSKQGLGSRKPIMDEALQLMGELPSAARYPYSGAKRIKERTNALEELIKQYTKGDY